MRKKIFGIALMAAIAVTAGWNISQNENQVKLSDLALNNVEALASDESDSSDCRSYCSSDYRYSCIIDYGGGSHAISCPQMRRK